MTTTTPGENAVRTFVGTAGQKLTLTVSANTFTAVDMTIRDPNGVIRHDAVRVDGDGVP